METTKSIKIGLFTNSEEIKKRITDTHEIWNYMVSFYMNLLLDMRGGDVYFRNDDGSVRVVPASFYSSRLIERIKKAAKENGNNSKLSPEDVSDFVGWCSNYYRKIMDSTSQPKGFVGILQNIQTPIQNTSNGGRSSSLICQTKLFVEENEEIMSVIKEEEVCSAFKNIGASKKNAEMVAKWLFDNYDILQEHYEGNVRLDKIYAEYPKEMKKKADKAAEKTERDSRFGVSGLNFLPLVQNSVNSYQREILNVSEIQDIKGASPWYYGAWSLAVQRLQSWDTWNRKASEEYQNEKKKVSEKQQIVDSLGAEYQMFFDKVLRKYEIQKNSEIQSNDLLGEFNGNYRILGRELRGLDEVLKKVKNKSSYEDRLKAVNELQSDDPACLGDVNLMRFIIEDEQYRYIPVDIEGCCKAVSAYKNLNKVLDRFDRLQDYACLTMCDEVSSPAWTAFEIGKEGKSGSNNPSYYIDLNNKTISLPLFSKSNDGLSLTPANKIRIKRSEQLLCLCENGHTVKYIDPGTRKEYDNVEIKGGKLQFDRDYISRHEDWKKRSGLKTYFNLSITIPFTAALVFDDYLAIDRASKVCYGFYFSNQEAKRFGSSTTKKMPVPLSAKLSEKPLRIMAVDLGLRAQFSYSVVKLQREKPDGRYHYPVRDFESGEASYAVHERSGQIRLLGDKPSAFVSQKRKELENSMDAIRYKIDAISNFRRLSSCRKEERKQKCEKLLSRYYSSTREWPYPSFSYQNLLSLTEKMGHLDDKRWSELIDSTAVKMKFEISKEYQIWARMVRKGRVSSLQKDNSEQLVGVAGKSMWNILYLTNVRRVMLKWHTFAEKSGERSGLKGKEVFAKELQQKINNIKEVREKESSDSLIMTALGYEWVAGASKTRMVKVFNKSGVVTFIHESEYFENKDNYKLYATGKENYRAKDGFWIKLYEPCDVIVFEELQAYRTDDERPTRENRMLMQWAHRSIVNQVTQQAVLHNIKIGQVGASFSSRFHAATDAPGVRGNIFTIEDLRNAFRELLEYGIKSGSNLSYSSRSLVKNYGDDVLSTTEKLIEALSIPGKESFGVVIPQDGGEYFISERESGIPFYINADINAAQNLAKRWITRYDNPQKITVKSEGAIFSVDNSSVRIRRVIGEKTFVIEYGDLENKFFSGYLADNSSVIKRPIDSNKEEDTEDEESDEFDRMSVFCDYSNVFFRKNEWVSSKKFWKTVRSRIAKDIVSHPLYVRI